MTDQEFVMAAVVFAGGLFLLVPISRALAVRIHSRPERAVDDGQVEQLTLHVERLQREMLETQERLDFAERLLAQRREAERLGSDASK